MSAPRRGLRVQGKRAATPDAPAVTDGPPAASTVPDSARQRSARPPQAARPAGAPQPEAAQGTRHKPAAGPARRNPPGEQWLRLFFAFKLPAEVTQGLAAAQSKLKGNWRKVAPEQLHLTLAYLPGVPVSRVAEVQRVAEQVAQDMPPLTLRLRGTGYHPNVGSPRVWFVKVEGEGLDELAARFRTALGELDVPLDDDPFRAHVTLARKKGPAPRVPPLQWELSWPAGQVTLIHSTLRKTGPIYDTVNRYRLSGEAPVSFAEPLTSEDAAPTPTGTSLTSPPQSTLEDHHG